MNRFCQCGVLVLLSFLGGCTELYERPTLPPEEAEAEISNMVNTMEADLQIFLSSDAAGILNQFFTLIDNSPEIFSRQEEVSSTEQRRLSETVEKLRESLNRFNIEGDPINTRFDFEQSRGEYNWVAADQRFVRVASSRFVILNFPTPGSERNDATLTVQNYQDAEFSIGGASVFKTTEIDANIVLDIDEVIDLRFRCAYDAGGLPTSLDYDVFISPFRLALDYDDIGSRVARLDIVATRGNEDLLTTGFRIEYADSLKTLVNFMEGFFRYTSVTIRATIDFAAADTGETFDYNDAYEIQIFNREAKLADVIYVFEETTNDAGATFEDWVPYVQYEDGSTKKTEEFTNIVEEEVDLFFSTIESWGF